MKNERNWWCGHVFLLSAIVTIFGCGSESSTPSTEPLRGILGSEGGTGTAADHEQEYTEDGVPIISTDQEQAEQQRNQASHTASGELTCTGIFDCFNGCADDEQSCLESCANQGSDQARAQVDAIALCMQSNQCSDNACVERECAQQLSDCGFGAVDGNDRGNSGESNTGSPSDFSDSDELDCNGIYECFGSCSEGARDCLDDCFGRGSTLAQSQVNEIGQCAQDNQCQDGACVETNCPSQVAACNGASNTEANTGMSPSSGTLSCAEIFECYGQCARGDQVCLDDCERAGTSAAQSQVTAIGNCIERNQCQDSGCVDRMCATEVANCDDGASPNGSNTPQEPNLGIDEPNSDSDTGHRTCSEVFECFNACPQNDRHCLDTCYEEGTALAQLAVSNVGSCVQANQCQDDQCVSRMCPEEVAACEAQSGGAPAGGRSDRPSSENHLSCTDIYACFADCSSEDQACRQDCFDRGSITSQAQVNAIGTCIQTHQCEDDECVESQCYDELTRCGFDIEIPEEETSSRDPLNPPQGDNGAAGDESDDASLGRLNGICGGAHLLTWGTQIGSTNGQSSLNRGTCSGNGSEAVFEFTLDEDTMICLDTFDSSFDTALYVRAQDCRSQDAEVACNDDTYGIQSQVYFSAEAGVTYYVFVDSYDLSGDFSLTAIRGDCRDRFGF